MVYDVEYWVYVMRLPETLNTCNVGMTVLVVTVTSWSEEYVLVTG